MNRKNRWFAALMAVVFGFVGVHKLYLGKIGGFILYLFLFFMSVSIFFMPLTFIFGLIDSFKIMSMSDEEFDEKYNYGVPQGIPRGRLEKRREEQMTKYNRPQVNNINNFKNKTKISTLKNSGLKKYKDFDLDDAILDFVKVLELNPKDSNTHFTVACAYSLTEQKEKAFRHLSLAVETGMDDVNRIITHDDLAFVRIQPEFDNFKKGGFRYTLMDNNSTQQEAILHQLQKISDLRNRGLLSELDFNVERKKILRQ